MHTDICRLLLTGRPPPAHILRIEVLFRLPSEVHSAQSHPPPSHRRRLSVGDLRTLTYSSSSVCAIIARFFRLVNRKMRGKADYFEKPGFFSGIRVSSGASGGVFYVFGFKSSVPRRTCAADAARGTEAGAGENGPGMPGPVPGHFLSADSLTYMIRLGGSALLFGSMNFSTSNPHAGSSSIIFL